MIVYGVWGLGDTIHDPDRLLGLFRAREDAEHLAAHPPVYNKGTQSEWSPECVVDEHEVIDGRL